MFFFSFLFFFKVVTGSGYCIITRSKTQQQMIITLKISIQYLISKAYQGSSSTAGCSQQNPLPGLLTVNISLEIYSVHTKFVIKTSVCCSSYLIRAIRTKRGDSRLCRPPDRETKRMQVSRASSLKKITVCAPTAWQLGSGYQQEIKGYIMRWMAYRVWKKAVFICN